MRHLALILTVLVLADGGWAGDEPQAPVAILPCAKGSPGLVNRNPSRRELKEARAAYDRGLWLARSQQREQALEQFERAVQLAPRNIEYLTAREMQRQELVSWHLENGNSDLLARRQVEALAEF